MKWTFAICGVINLVLAVIEVYLDHESLALFRLIVALVCVVIVQVETLSENLPR